VATKVIMPALGMAQETGVLLQWLKKEGEQITKGEPLMEIETDKATVEIEATANGILANITAGPGDEVPVGQQIAIILAPGETAGEQRGGGAEEKKMAEAPATSASAVTASPVAARIAAEHNIDLAQIKPQGTRVQKSDVLAYLDTNADGGQRSAVGGLLPASPKARRLARERGLDLSALTGSGPNGAVLTQDVLEFEGSEAAAPVSPAEPAPAETLAVSPAWRVMVERLTQSWSSVPHFYLLREVEASRLTTWRSAAQKNSTGKITYTDLLVKVVAAALRQHSRLNASWQEGTIKLNEAINIGLAVATSDGLVVPVVYRADTLTLAELAQRRQEVIGRANEGKLKLSDIQNGTFTISNLGMYGVDAFNAIINPPQAAILAVSRIADRIVPVNGQPAVRPMLTLTLSCDHRVVDGARAAQFLDALAALIEEPLGLIN
jgi:pyruvate dehydrogenase E2 component (dihydrolipoamide acetyltransferase)